MTTKKNPIVLTGSMYIDDQFVSKKYVTDALYAAGVLVLKQLPKEGDATVVAGTVLGKRKSTRLESVAKNRGIDVVAFDSIVTPRVRTELKKVLNASDKLLKSEQKLLEAMVRKTSKKKKKTKAA